MITYSKETLMEIKSINILDLASKLGIEVIQTGTIYQAKCKHDGDNTPSLTFYPDTNTFYCFGCKTNGDTIRLVCWYLDLPFPEAIKKVVEMYDIQVEPGQTVVRPNLMSKNRTYWKTLDENQAAKDYLLSRNIDNEDMIKWRLGLVPEGLKYEGRLVFAIIDERAETVGFAYRTLNGDKPKYINSANSDCFTKGSVLYGYNYAKDILTDKDPLVIVEGYTDVIQLQKLGIPAVGCMGTAISKNQIDLIRRITNSVILYMDGDLPGWTAMEKMVPQFRTEGLQVKIMIAGDKDPDEKAINLGSVMKDFIKENSYLMESYKIQKILAKHHSKQDELNIKLLDQVLPLLATISNQVDLEYQIAVVAASCHIDKAAIYSMLSKGGYYGRISKY